MIDFLCVGFQKAGTSWLNAALKQHPGIWLPFIKELHYFDVVYLDYPADYQYDVLKRAVDNLRAKIDSSAADSYYEKILDRKIAFTDKWYLHIFSAARKDQLKGEVTPRYSCLPTRGISHIVRLSPNVKIIILVRDPVERAKSQLRMFIEKSPEKSQLEFLRSPGLVSRSNYKDNICRWESCISSNQILYIPFGRVKKNPLQLMETVEDFLCLPRFEGYSRLSKPIHESKEISIDEKALTLIQNNSEIQYHFLNKKFGFEFVEETR